MVRHQSILIILALFLMPATLITSASAEKKLWVTSTHAKLKSDRKASSTTIATLPRGTALNVVSKQGSWYEVTTSSGERGWIYRGKVSSNPPEEEGGGLFGSMSGSSIDVAKADTARSIRGLSPEAEEYARKTGTPASAQRSLDQVLAMRTTNSEIDRFLREGKIGEYAE